MNIGSFEVHDNTKINNLTLRLASNSEIDFSGSQKIKIIRDDGINIALSSSITFEDDKKSIVIQFNFPFYIKTGNYTIKGNFLHIDNTEYHSYLTDIALNDADYSYNESQKQIASISMKGEETPTDNSLFKKVSYSTDALSYNL